MEGRKRYSLEFEREAVQLVTGRGVTLAQLSRELGVPLSVLRGWLRAMQADPVHAFPGHGGMLLQDLDDLLGRRTGPSSWGLLFDAEIDRVTPAV